MPELNIHISIVKRKSSVKFLRVMLDKNIAWKDHIKTIETKKKKPKILVYYITQNHFLKKGS